MKVGLSLSRCIRDIYEGKVDIDDVLVLITRTDFDPTIDEQWSNIWKGYSGGRNLGSFWSNPEWHGIPEEDEDKLRSICLMLYNDGKIHQPRKFGAHPRRRPEIWLETVLPSSELDSNPAAKKAWEHFQTVAGLAKVDLDKEYQ